MSRYTVKVITWKKLCEAVHEDQVLVKLKEWLLQGFPQSSHDVDEDLRVICHYMSLLNSPVL